MLRAMLAVLVVFFLTGCWGSGEGSKPALDPSTAQKQPGEPSQQAGAEPHINPDDLLDPNKMNLVEIIDYGWTHRAKPKPERVRYHPPIDHLLAGLPVAAVPPVLKFDDSLGWAKLTQFVNRGMPKPIELKVEVYDVTFETAGNDRFLPTLALEPRVTTGGFLGSYMGQPSVIDIASDRESDFFFSNDHKLEPVDEAEARRLLELKGKQIPLVLDTKSIEFTPGYVEEVEAGFELPGKRFAPNLKLTVRWAEVVLPPGMIAGAEVVSGRYRLRCQRCQKDIFSSQPATANHSAMFFPGLDPDLDKKSVPCPSCGSLGPFATLPRRPFGVSHASDLPQGQGFSR